MDVLPRRRDGRTTRKGVASMGAIPSNGDHLAKTMKDAFQKKVRNERRDRTPEIGLGLSTGTRLRARLESTASTAVRAPVSAVVEYTYERDGQIVIPAGAKAVGHIQEADRSGYVRIHFESLMMPDGATVPIQAVATDLDMRPLKGKVEGKNAGKNVLVRSLSGIGQAGALLLGRGSLNQPLSESDLMRASLRAEMLDTDLSAEQVEEILLRQENRWWSVKLQSLGSKEHFLRYAGRYARRPPIAQRRITNISKQVIEFRAKDRRLSRQSIVRLKPEQFLAAWIQHIPERYEHAVRSFGLFAPRAIRGGSAAAFTILGQSPRPRPRPLSWSLSIKRDFGWDPLLDHNGNRMKWTRRIAPILA